MSLFLFALHSGAGALTLQEALESAKKNLPAYQASKLRVKSSDSLYKASLSPYLPTLDVLTSQQIHDTDPGNYEFSLYDVTMSYLLFDGGNRRANRNIARLNLDIDREELNRVYLDLEFDIKRAFYSTMARQKILEQRRIQLDDARKDHEVAEGRHRLGAARLSDVLQASVRLEQARFNLTQAEGLLRNGLSELNSLMGRPLETGYDLQGVLGELPTLPPLEDLSQAALARPEVKQSEDQVLVSKNIKSVSRSRFFPTISTNSSFTRTRRTNSPGGSSLNDASVELKATWNLFEWDKFYRTRSAELNIDVAEQNLDEIQRQILLDVAKAYEDLATAARNISVAESQVKQAEQNYSQAFGEYKIGKGDILALVQAEGFLAQSREQLVASRLGLALAKALLERNVGVETLENMVRVSQAP